MPDPPDPAAPSTQRPAPSAHEKPTDETIKETFESIVMALILAFTFRAYVVEAFVIPTGSMAPTLLGRHEQLTSPQTGYRFDVDYPGAVPPGRDVKAVSPMIGGPTPMPVASPGRTGDRILVHKFIYLFSEPQRWDVVVFKNPQFHNEDGTPGPQTNYIKRLIGLPNEQLLIFQGNIYTKPINQAEDAPWRVARKSDRPEVQRAVWQPIYHSSFIPLDPSSQWTCPWRPVGDTAGQWRVQGRRRYRYDGEGTARLRFDFDAGAPGVPYDEAALVYPYNQFEVGQMYLGDEFIEDVRLAALVEPDEPGLTVRLSTTARLDNPQGIPQTLSAVVNADGAARLEKTAPGGQPVTLGQPVDIGPLPAGEPTNLELWYVDQEASLWVNGDRVLRVPFHLPIDLLKKRPAPPKRPDLGITLTGGSATLNRVELDRDLFYNARGQAGTERMAHGGIVRIGDRLIGSPLTIGPDEFFCIGDNNPRSADGRYWRDIYPWVQKRYFHDRPRTGLVPRDLMIGRAFFVYLPAPYPWRQGARGILPNFGDMRFIH